MTTDFTNNTNIPLSVAVWLASDNYDHPPNDGKKYISATGLMKSVRQIVLGQRIGGNGGVEDVQNRLASRFGTAIHDGIEKAWTDNHKEALTALGYPEAVRDRIRVNPADPDEPNIIPIYMEQRFYKEVGDWVVTGQYDFVGDGRLEDFKSTSTYVYQNSLKDNDYIQQGSIYRWGVPEIITQDVMAIQYFFKDWQRFKVSDPSYPPAMMVEKLFTLKSESETDSWIKNKLFQIELHQNTPEAELPECTPEELWQKSSSVWKYYKDPNKTTRATKNFDNASDANLRFVNDGRKGLIIEVKPEPTGCKYCSAFNICTQKDKYIKDGTLKV